MSWAPIDLGPYLRGEVAETRPTALARDDGERLLYGGLVTWLSGESESLKSWLAQVAVAEQLRAGATALYLDFESDPLPIAQRFVALGVNVEAIEGRLVYIRPEEPLSDEDGNALLALLAERQPTTSVLDGVNAAMAISGLNPLDVKDFYQWARLVREVEHATSGATLVVDHVVKDSTQRGRYAYGSVAKLNVVDGAHLGVELVDQFGRGLTGRALVRVHKDRPGWLRGLVHKDVLAEFTLHSRADGGVASTLAAITEETKVARRFRPTHLMERVSAYVEQAEAPASQSMICKDVRGNKEALIQAIHVLADEGYLAVTQGPRGALYRSVRLFLELEDLIAGSSGNVPKSSLEPVSQSSWSSSSKEELLQGTLSMDPQEPTGSSAEEAGAEVVASLRGRGLRLRLGEHDKILAGPGTSLDESDRALLVEAHESIVAALKEEQA